MLQAKVQMNTVRLVVREVEHRYDSAWTALAILIWQSSNSWNGPSTLAFLPVPIFNRNQGNIRRAQAELQQACAEMSRVRLVLQDQLTETFRRYETARDQVASLRLGILPDAKETLDLTM